MKGIISSFKKRVHLFIIPPLGVVVVVSGVIAGYFFEAYEAGKERVLEEQSQQVGIMQDANSTGTAFADYDNDGYDDLFIVGGSHGVRLYLNTGRGTFFDVSEESGVGGAVQDGNTGMGVAFADYDNDGCPDIYMARPKGGSDSVSSDILYKNNCDGTFSDVSKGSGVGDALNGRGVAWADYNSDGFLDLYVANHGYQGEEYYEFEPNILYRNNGDGTFEDVTQEAQVGGFANCPNVKGGGPNHTVVGGPGWKLSFQPLWFDYNNDNLIDLFVTTDSGASPLYRNNGDGTFEDVTQQAGMCRIGTGMGVSAGDYDGNGHLDVYVTNTGANYFWHNNGDGTFDDVAAETGTADHMSLGWGVGFFDYDNDGLLDMYVTNGKISGMVDVDPAIGTTYIDKLYRNTGEGTFEEVGEKVGIKGDDAKEATAFSDYNNNGFVDVVVMTGYLEKEALHRFYYNKGNDNNWLSVRLTGQYSNRDAVGARITATTDGQAQMREVTAGSSYLSQHSLTQTFGLGEHEKVDVLHIRWPSGKETTLHNVEARQILTIREGEDG